MSGSERGHLVRGTVPVERGDRGRLPEADRRPAGPVHRPRGDQPAVLGPAHVRGPRRRGRSARLPGRARRDLRGAAAQAQAGRAALAQHRRRVQHPGELAYRGPLLQHARPGPDRARPGELRVREAPVPAEGLPGPRRAVAAVREPARAPLPPRDRDVRRGLAFPRRGDLAQAQPDAGGKVPPATPPARDHLPVRPRGAASVPHRAPGRLRLGIQQREAHGAEALLPVS